MEQTLMVIGLLLTLQLVLAYLAANDAKAHHRELVRVLEQIRDRRST